MGQLCCSKYSPRPGDKLHASASGCRQDEREYPEWSTVDKSKCQYPETLFSGSYSWSKSHEVEFEEHPEDSDDFWTIAAALEHLKENPEMYYGMMYQSNMKDFPEDQQKAKLICRNGSGFDVTPVPNGPFTYVSVVFVALNNKVKDEPDEYTESVLGKYSGKTLGKPKRPGRGEGCADVPTICLFDEADPTDVRQGQVGDCWLLSAISGLAEYEGAIAKCFEKTPHGMPGQEFNTYSVTLYQMPDYKPVVLKIDERLCTKDGNHLLGAQPTPHGELWPCILEKAVAAHCGGWDEIDGGTCTHAWRLLTGCEECFTLKKKGDDEWGCFGTKNANSGEWEKLDNSPHKGFQGLWPMHWPGDDDGDIGHHITADEMFANICQWCDNHFILGAGTKSGSDSNATDGIVDGHAYTILSAHEDVAGAGVNLIQVRNPWGKGEYETGEWDDDGPGWDQHPEVKEFLQPVALNDGKFWMSQDEFFRYFHTVYLCAQDMGSFIHK